MKYYYNFQESKKIDDKTTRLANVTVFDTKFKKIGCANVAKWQSIDDVTTMIIRDYELSKVWNSKEFSFNKLI